MKTKTVLAYSSLDMWFHKHMIHFVAFLTLSGLPILSEKFHFIAYGIGHSINFLAGDMNSEGILASGISFLRVIHWLSAFTFTAIMIPFVISMTQKVLTLSIWPDKWGASAVFEGIGEMKKNYIDLEHAEFGKMNTGQKASAWLLTVCMVVIVISGYILIFRSAITHDIISIARGAHAISFIVLAVTLLIHIYFATHPANQAAYKAMFKTGEMDEEYVKEHHSLWYRKLQKL
ncbi:MAG: cytochrome b/b6 domain-containing protein [Sulfurospirillaceae bacterium]|jgi:formate dehydrogenase subunit gamma|nr:cytochrome b/b6 domain-containing protein [Sulfurospirillaceae bacterium]MDD2826463.1 cytochrome b/b6 domain-containing protein [Sulfurospirillaceae bacterium]